MNTYKLTMPCTKVDINGNITDSETTVMFDNKDELIQYLSGDTDGDEYGSSLSKIQKFDKELYREIGLMCNHLTRLFNSASSNTTIDAIP